MLIDFWWRPQKSHLLRENRLCIFDPPHVSKNLQYNLRNDPQEQGKIGLEILATIYDDISMTATNCIAWLNLYIKGSAIIDVTIPWIGKSRSCRNRSVTDNRNLDLRPRGLFWREEMPCSSHTATGKWKAKLHSMFTLWAAFLVMFLVLLKLTSKFHSFC